MIRNFDGVDDEIRCALGACNLTGGFTIAALLKRNANGAYHAIIGNHTAADAGTVQIWLADSGKVQLSTSGANSSFSTSTVTVADGWVIVVVRKPAGTSTPRFSFFKAGAWTHEDGTSGLADAASQAGGTVRFGEWQDQDDGNFRLALAAEWTTSGLSDAQVAALATGLNRSAWTGHAIPPAAVWAFNQSSAATPVSDLVGTSHQSAVQGTSVITDDDPPGWVGFAGADEAPANTVAPAVTGTAQVPQTLTVTPGTWTGSPSPTVTRKWQRSDNGTSGWADISGETGLTYAQASADEGKYLSVLESATNTAGGPITQRSNVVGPVAAAPPLDVTVRLTGGSGNTNAAASLGGVESSTSISLSPSESGLLPALIDRTLADPGATVYRCVSVHNGDATRSATVKAYISQPFSRALALKIGVAAQAAGTTVAAIANQTTAPASVTFSAPASEGAALDLGTVGPGQGRGLWHALTVPASAAEDASGDGWAVRLVVTPIP